MADWQVYSDWSKVVDYICCKYVEGVFAWCLSVNIQCSKWFSQHWEDWGLSWGRSCAFNWIVHFNQVAYNWTSCLFVWCEIAIKSDLLIGFCRCVGKCHIWSGCWDGLIRAVECGEPEIDRHWISERATIFVLDFNLDGDFNLLRIRVVWRRLRRVNLNSQVIVLISHLKIKNLIDWICGSNRSVTSS